MADQTQQGTQTLTPEQQAEHAAAVELEPETTPAERAVEIERENRRVLARRRARLGDAALKGAQQLNSDLGELDWLDNPRVVRPPDSDGGPARRPDGIPAEGKELCSVRLALCEPTITGRSGLEIIFPAGGTEMAEAYQWAAKSGVDLQELLAAFRWGGEQDAETLVKAYRRWRSHVGRSKGGTRATAADKVREAVAGGGSV